MIPSSSHWALCSNNISCQNSLINTRTNQVQQTLPTGKQPQGVAVDEHTGTVYAINQAAQSATVLDPTPSSKQQEIARLIKEERHLVLKLASVARQIAHLEQNNN